MQSFIHALKTFKLNQGLAQIVEIVCIIQYDQRSNLFRSLRRLEMIMQELSLHVTVTLLRSYSSNLSGTYEFQMSYQ